MIDPVAILSKVAPHAGSATLPILAGYMLFTPQTDYQHLEHDLAQHVAESERGYILDTVEKARVVEPGDFKDSLCRTLDDAIGRLCAAAPTDAICQDRQQYRRRAGCE